MRMMETAIVFFSLVIFSVNVPRSADSGLLKGSVMNRLFKKNYNKFNKYFVK